MFLPYPTKVNRDLGCSPKPMSKPAQHGVIHVGQPWSISQARNQFRVSHRFGRAVDGSALLHTLPTTRAAAVGGLISQPDGGLCACWGSAHPHAGAAHGTTAPGIALRTQEASRGITVASAKWKSITQCRCPCCYFSQPSLLSCRHHTWSDEFGFWVIWEPAQMVTTNIPRNVPVHTVFTWGLTSCHWNHSCL